MKNGNKKKVVVVGGGTGTYTVLSGLKKYPSIDLSVIVSMMDSGGSNRVIRDEFGLLPTSDIRQCIIALSEERPKDIVRELFTYRFNSGTGIAGMTFGNLFMAALSDIYGSQQKAIEKTCEFLDVKGQIIPVTFDKTNLVAMYDNGKQVLGEHDIDDPGSDLSHHKIVEVSVFPKAEISKEATVALKSADIIVFGPGDLYTSILPNLVVGGFTEALSYSRAKIVYITNLMTRLGQTSGFKASDFLTELERYLKVRKVDYVLINSGSIPDTALAWYKRVEAEPVTNDLNKGGDRNIMVADFVHRKIHKKDSADILTRSLIRHDPDKLAKALYEICSSV